MKEVHKGMGITDKEFDAVAADLRQALVKLNGVKDADAKELLDIVGTTRKDIVEEKKDEKKEEGKKPKVK
jgi:truncated hemoglobin YjbI